jgi:hypothetical protein
MNTGSVGKTCSTAILTDGDFGGTVNAINGGFPFTLYPLSLDWLSNYFLLLLINQVGSNVLPLKATALAFNSN